MTVYVHMTEELCLWFVKATPGEDLKLNIKKPCFRETQMKGERQQGALVRQQR